MNWIAVSFVVLSCLSAGAAGWALRRWAHAAAALVGAIGLLWLVTSMRLSPTAKLFVPLVTGAASAAAVLIPLLVIRPAASVRVRATLSTIAAFAAHSTFIHYAMATR